MLGGLGSKQPASPSPNLCSLRLGQLAEPRTTLILGQFCSLMSSLDCTPSRASAAWLLKVTFAAARELHQPPTASSCLLASTRPAPVLLASKHP